MGDPETYLLDCFSPFGKLGVVTFPLLVLPPEFFLSFFNSPLLGPSGTCIFLYNIIILLKKKKKLPLDLSFLSSSLPFFQLEPDIL